MSDNSRILVFGSSGSGKTSMLNQLTGESRDVGDGVLGVTFRSSSFDPIQRGDNTYIFWDTTGLNEGDKGKIPGKKAVKALIELLRESKEGYNLLIHVIRTLPRTTDIWVNNHLFFVETIAEKKIPVILVFTGCEDSDPMSGWYTQNANDLEKLGLKADKVVCACFHQAKATGGRSSLAGIYAKLRQKSGDDLWEEISNNALPDPVILYDDENKYLVIFKRVINFLARIFAPDLTVLPINQLIQKLLERMGFTKGEAQSFAETGKFPEKEE